MRDKKVENSNRNEWTMILEEDVMREEIEQKEQKKKK